MVGGHRQFLSVDILSGLHQGEAEPGVGSGDELAEEFGVEADYIAIGDILTVVPDSHVLNDIGNQISQSLVVHLGRKLERPVFDPKIIVAPEHEVK